jgi:hypothetical protein
LLRIVPNKSVRHCERSDASAEALAKAEAIHPSAYDDEWLAKALGQGLSHSPDAKSGRASH